MENKKIKEEVEENAIIKITKSELDEGIKQGKKMINNINFYENEGITIGSFGEENSGRRLYLANIIKNDTNYLGLLNNRLKREALGLSQLKSGDKYFGFYSKDIRSGNGIYLFKPVKTGNKIITEIHWGMWKDNKMNGKGTYLWLKEDENKNSFNDYDSADFDIFSGIFKDSKYNYGVYMSKKKDSYYVYYGNMDDKGNRTGDECYYYNSDEDKLLYGKMKDNYFISTYLAVFDDEGALSDLLLCEFDDNHNIINYTEFDSIDNDSMENIKAKVTNFRFSILKVDYFGNAFNMFKNIVKDIKTIKIENFISEVDYPKLISKLSYYSQLGIFETIKNNLI